MHECRFVRLAQTGGLRVLWRKEHRRLARHTRHEVFAVRIVPRHVDHALAPVVLIHRGMRLQGEQPTQHTSLRADALRECAGVDAVDGWDALLLEPVTQA